jgi:hypothetical protein
MRRVVTTVFAVLLAVGLLGATPAVSAGKTIAGKKCKIAGLHRMVKGQEFVCTKRKGKLVWVLVQKDDGGGSGGGGNVGANMPLITAFAAGQPQQSDQLPVDMDGVDRTSPFFGVRAPNPHQGLHVHWSNTEGRWSDAGGASNPDAYPAIYAIADGVVTRVDLVKQVGDNTASGISVTFAHNAAGQDISADYSIEPMIPEPSAGFLAHFIKVKVGQVVHKGDVLARIYVPPTSTGATHLHMQLDAETGGQPLFLAPAVFTPEAVTAFAAKFADTDSGQPIPPCMGWKLDAAENPFGTGAVDCL